MSYDYYHLLTEKDLRAIRARAVARLERARQRQQSEVIQQIERQLGALDTELGRRAAALDNL